MTKAANYQTSSADWQIELSQAISDPLELLALLALNPALANRFITKEFPLRVPRGFVARMEKGNPNDPLLLQVLPALAESLAQSGFVTDPLKEQSTNPQPGLLHKYQDRALLIATGICAINCRYCFRRYFPYEGNNPGRAGWQQSLSYVAAHPKIKEIILSGGDPLMLKDKQLAELIQLIAAIPHIKRLRIHSRLPIVLPSRITENLISVLTQTRLQAVMVVHANHPNEIDDSVITAMQQLQRAAIPVFNQAVLLKNINDSVATLIALSETLFNAHIIPYYLHLLDKVKSAGHFEVSEAEAKKLMQALLKQLPGYLVPKLVQEIAGAASKVPINFYH